MKISTSFSPLDDDVMLWMDETCVRMSGEDLEKLHSRVLRLVNRRAAVRKEMREIVMAKWASDAAVSGY